MRSIGAMKLREPRTPWNSFRVRATLAATALALATTFGTFGSACSNQSEGQRCSVLGDNAGTDDCQSVSSTGVPLVCKPKTQLNGAQDDLCCPQNPAQATVPACQAPGSSGIVPPPPSEAGPTTDAALSDASDATTADTSLPDTSLPDTSTPDAADSGGD